MKSSKQRKIARAIVADKSRRQSEAERITQAQIKLRDDKWGAGWETWKNLISHWQPIKE